MLHEPGKDHALCRVHFFLSSGEWGGGGGVVGAERGEGGAHVFFSFFVCLFVCLFCFALFCCLFVCFTQQQQQTAKINLSLLLASRNCSCLYYTQRPSYAH